MESEHVVISNLTNTIDRCYELIETFMFDVRFEKQNETKLRLLAEETLTFLKDIVDGNENIFWIQGDKKNCDLEFLCKKQLTPEKKADLLSMSSTGKNTSYRGFKGIIKGLFANPDELSSKWTLTDYQFKVARERGTKNGDEIADELEKTIIASLADEIEVSIENDHIRMVVSKRF